MPITVGVNSWVTIAQADAYLATKYGAGAWAALSVADKTALLVTAFNLIRRQSGYDIAATSTDQAVKDAQCEVAWFWYVHGEEWDKRSALYASGVRSFTVMSWREDLQIPTLPQFIKDMLTAYSLGSGNFISRVTRDY